MKKIDKLKIEIYADGAELLSFKKLKKLGYIKGYTTNPSLMRKAGVKHYKIFAKKVIEIVKPKPISFEIFEDTSKKIEEQANKISKWGENVYVKIPVINTKKIFNSKLIGKLNKNGIKLNVTAIFTIDQTKNIIKYIGKKTPIILSVFLGRVADTGIDPEKEIIKHLKITKKFKNVKLLWASVREPFNIIQAERSKCHIITIPPNIIEKTKVFGKKLDLYSQETVKEFYNDAKNVGYKI
jgi:transaldolase